MSTVIRHSGASHAMRPDRVARTGVLAPIVGYQPQADVQMVAAEFTGGGLSGAGTGLFQRLAARSRAWFASRGAARAMAVSTTTSSSQQPAPQQSAPPASPAAQQANQVAPQIAAQMQMLQAIPDDGPEQAITAQAARWNGAWSHR